MEQLKKIVLITYLLSAGFTAHAYAFEIKAKQKADTVISIMPYSIIPDENNTQGVFPKSAQAVLEGLEVNGFYRFITNYRDMSVTYPHLENNKRNIFVGDDSQIPQLMLNIKGFASSKTSFGTDLFMWAPMTGLGQTENVKGLNLGVNLFGNFNTSFGTFNVRTGGINWHLLSPFTFQANKGYNRYSLFERNPWDPNTASMDSRYVDFFNSGAINQDQRWGNQAFQGLIIDGAQLPNDFAFSLMTGKTQFDGGVLALPNNSFGGKLTKFYKQHQNSISANSFNNNTYLDSLAKNTTGFSVHTLEITHYIERLKIWAEIGIGNTHANQNYTKYGEAISVKLAYPIADQFPTEIHFYRVSPRVFNNNAIFINSSIQQSVQSNSNLTQAVLIPVSSAILPIGQLANNRQGIEINSQLNFGRLKNSIGYSSSMELENLSPGITYSHAFNSLALSRFWRWGFPSNVGPYKNLNKIYRNVFETLNITDINPTTGLPNQKKYFNTLEINSKYKTILANKDLYLFYLGSFNSVQNFSSMSSLKDGGLLVFTERALVRNYCHQIESYYVINPKLIWNNYLSFERIIANYQTAIDVQSSRPKNQTGYSFATGLDIQLSKSAGLYLRQRWMDYQDSSYANDQYKGFETTVEVKMFF